MSCSELVGPSPIIGMLEEGNLAKLTDISDRGAVSTAIAEFRQLGRDDFLTKYGFSASTEYFLLDGDTLIDTKPVVAAAYGFQYPERGPLTWKDFSGGRAGAVPVLERLGFRVGTRVQLLPPRLGDEYANRTAISEAYGGDKVGGIIYFPGERVVNMFSDAKGPYADDPPTLTETFGYRGQGLNGNQRVEFGGNARLEDAWKTKTAARFWYRPQGGDFTFLTWAAVLGRSWTPGVGKDGQLRSEIDWHLRPVHNPEQSEWPDDVESSLRDVAGTSEDEPNVPEANANASYADLVGRVESRGQKKRPTGVVRTDFVRSAAARRAVLVRCGGVCESDRCTGMPAELNRRGEPILDVDHVIDLALGGDDHPINMVALCPNCHATKTRGANSMRWRRELARVAKMAHASSLNRSA